MRYTIGTFKNEETNNTDFLTKIESKLTFTRDETQKYITKKFPDGRCIFEYKGESREGVIMGMGTNGTYQIGLLREEY
jgi:hypothetical protein